MEKDKSFNQGLITGIAIISTVAFVGLLIYVLTGGKLTTDVGNKDDKGKTAKQFEQCLESGKYDSVIQTDQSLGVQLGVRGTPATFINGYLVSGALPYDMVKLVIDDLLAGKEPSQDFLKDSETDKIVKIDMPQITDQDHKTGATNGQITMLEFSDFECPYCGRFNTTSDEVLKNYGDKVTVIFKHFPLSFHQYAKPAAVASECANEQGKFWEMHNKLFALNIAGTVNTENIKKAAAELGLK